MTVLAARPDSWDFPLFLHVAGAMTMVAGVLAAACALALAGGDARLLRLGYRSLLFVGLPGYVVMRAAAEWIADMAGYTATGAPAPTWLGIGFIVADVGALLLIIALIVGGIGVSRMRRGRGGEGLLKTPLVISLVLLVAYTVAVWAMAGKPS